MFKDIFGDSPQTKILDFLADYPDFDYSVSEIAKNSNVSRPTVYKVIEILLKKNLVIKTREQGNSPLFKLNLENKLVQLILQFDFDISGKLAEIEKENSLKEYSKTFRKTVRSNAKPKPV